MGGDMQLDAFSPTVSLVLGAILLLLGRKLFWIFVGAVGFLVGFNLASQYLSDQSIWVILLVAIVAGIIGSVLAVILQRVATLVAGFLVGGYLTVQLLQMLEVDLALAEGVAWLPYVLGGIVGAVLLFALFDWALIFLSSLVGATLITPVINPEPEMETIVFIIVLLVGIVVQATLFRREQPAPA
jgi:hypothetical protein